MARKDNQWKYNNNQVIAEGYIRAEVKQEDCIEAGSEFYVCTVPQGAVVLGAVAFLKNVEDENEEVNITVSIGSNDCEKCETFNMNNVDSKEAICVDGCKCTVIDKSVPVLVKFEDKLESGSLMLLIKVINTEHSICRVVPVEPDTKEIILDHCIDSCKDC